MTYDPDNQNAHSESSSSRKPPVPNRAPVTPVEQWACDGLISLSADDPDGARARNGVGWNQMDSEFGHSLAAQYRNWGKLSEKQIAMAVCLATKYAGQLPPRPAAPVPPGREIAESPEVEALKREIRAGEARLDALLADPDGPRCVNRDSEGAFGICGNCAWGMRGGRTTPERESAKATFGANFSVCVAIPWIAERRAKILELRGEKERAAEIRTEMGLIGGPGASGEGRA